MHILLLNKITKGYRMFYSTDNKFSACELKAAGIRSVAQLQL